MKKFLSRALIVPLHFLSFNAFALVGPELPGAAQFLERGQQLAEEGRLREALAAFDLAKQENPTDVRPYIYSGRALLSAGRLEDARNEIQQVVSLDIATAADALECARVLDGVGWLAQGSSVLEEFSSSVVLENEGLYLLADLYYRQRRSQEALRTLDKLNQRSPRDERVDLLRGEVHLMAGDYAEARRFFQSAVRANPSEAAALHGLGKATWLADGSDACKDPLARAIAQDPENGGYLHILGIVCFKLDQQEEAIRHLKRATETRDAPAQIFFDLGNAYRKAGMREEAREALAQYQKLYAAEQEEDNRNRKIEQLMNQARQQLDAGSILEAVQSFQRIVEADPAFWPAHVFLAKIYVSSGRAHLALPHIQKALEIAPENSEGSFLMAAYLNERRDYGRALEYAKRSKELLPGNPQLRNLLGNLYLNFGQEQEAREEYRAAMNLDPGNAAFRMNYESVRKR